MKAVILAGGLGTRIAEESHLRPKPMIEIGGRPILWHVMNIYTSHGVTDFVICLGYRGYMIKEYLADSSGRRNICWPIRQYPKLTPYCLTATVTS